MLLSLSFAQLFVRLAFFQSYSTTGLVPHNGIVVTTGVGYPSRHPTIDVSQTNVAR